MEDFEKIIKENPNDTELGKVYRLINSNKNDLLCIKFPNNSDLGKKVRENFYKLKK
jgi:ribosomal 30S subunit maturation factor RimM